MVEVPVVSRRGLAKWDGSLVRVVVLCAALTALLAVASSAAGATRAKPSIDAHGSVEQVYVRGLAGHAKMTLTRNGHKVATQKADGQGGLLFRELKPGGGYQVGPASGGEKSKKLRVLSTKSAPPSQKIYNQTIPTDGYGYLKTRDGTKLAIDVHPPSDVAGVVPGLKAPVTPPGTPSPTLIEYSGYGYADPDGPMNGISVIANLMGFTVVDINMRGTGCSGGAYDFFEPLQSLDGYDAIETVAHQPWVKGHKVGMMGISYGAISQLFTAATRPPSLAAISPLSTIDATQTTLYPGGVLNTGFAVNWAKERVHDALPASPTGGQSYAYDQIQAGDQICKANQDLHGEAVNLLQKIRDNSHYKPKVADPLSPLTFVHKINVPTYLACQFTDEQTGGHCPTLASAFTGTDKKWFTFTNGTHVDSLDPATLDRWFDFLEIYVAKEAPINNAAVINAAAPVIYNQAMGINGVTLPPDPIQAQPTLAGAQSAFENLKPVRILFDNGAGGSSAGQPQPGFEQSFDKFPIPGTKAKSWYLGSNGKLSGKKSKRSRADSFKFNTKARSFRDFSGDTAAGPNGLWTATPPYHWKQSKKGGAVSYVSSPLTKNTTVIGAGAVHLWVRSPKPNVDLQATLTEVRPDGKETFVQNGWLRGNERKLDAKKSTPLEPVLSLRKSDVKAFPKHRYVPVTIPMYYEGHAYRAGSRMRITIAAPNGDQPVWGFGEAQPKSHPKVSIAYSKKRPSKLTLPVVPGVNVPTSLPPCPGLRGEPCRSYVPLKNHRAKH